MSPTGSSGPIRFSCPHCGTCLKVPATAVGQEGQCPHCRKIIRATDSSDAGYALRDDMGQTHSDAAELVPVVCTLCATRMYATPDQVGRTIVCPDCETVNTIHAPRRPAKRRSVPAPVSPPYQVRAPEQLDRPQQIVQEMLSQAARRAEEEVRNRPKPLRHPFWSGVYASPFQPTIGIPCLILAIGATAVLIVITSIGRLHPAQVLFACILAAVGTVATVLFASVWAPDHRADNRHGPGQARPMA